MRSSNPALSPKIFSNTAPYAGGQTMTIQGTVNKSAMLLFLVFLSASWVWARAPYVGNYMIFGCIGGLIAAMVTIFKKEWSPISAPIYALFEGLAIGGMSVLLEGNYPGIVVQAVALTFGTLVGLLFLYKARIIKVTEQFRKIVTTALMGIFIVYIASFLLGIFGLRVPMIHEGGIVGIGFSLFVVAIAASMLVMDFDFIERASENNLPQYMEWYGAFGLMVTLIWLYMEILILLSKLRGRR